MGRKGRHPKGGRVTPKGTRPKGFQPRLGDEELWPEAEPDLGNDLRDALLDPEPLALLSLVSTLLAALDHRPSSPFERHDDEDEAITREQLLESMLEVDRVETSGVLAVMAALSTDEVERRRISRALEQRGHRLPPWLGGLDQAAAHRTIVQTHVLGDGEGLLVGVRLPTGHELTVAAYVDHNLGTVVKDAFVVPERIDKLVAQMQRKFSDPHVSVDDLDPAESRARLTEAITTGAMLFPPIETDTWPSSRPLVEWMLRLLPEGGRGYERPDWSEEQREELVERFLASPQAAGFDTDQRDLADTLVWFGCDYGPGDPLRWSPPAVEIVLADWLPRKVVAPVAYLAKAPSVLRVFVAFAHAERAIPTALTDETLAAIDEWEDDYQVAIRSPRPQGPAALLAAMGAPDPEGGWPDPDEAWIDIDLGELATRWRGPEDAVGGPEALAALDDEPLPDEPFDWSAVPEDLHDRVAEVVALCDRCCDELFDVEHRTAVRRVLARVARDGGDALRRPGRSDTAAAALCWAVGKANESISAASGAITQKAFLEHLGLPSGVSTRASTLLKAAGFPRVDTYQLTLGSPAYLTSGRRRRLIERRDRGF